MSHSTSSTVLPLEAMAWASWMAMVVLPSLGTEEVTAMERMGSSTEAKRMFAASVLIAFCIWIWLIPALAFFAMLVTTLH